MLDLCGAGDQLGRQKCRFIPLPQHRWPSAQRIQIGPIPAWLVLLAGVVFNAFIFSWWPLPRRIAAAGQPTPGDAPAHRQRPRAQGVRRGMIFDFEARPSNSPFVERIWRTPERARRRVYLACREPLGRWSLTRHNGKMALTVRGPETKATSIYCSMQAEWFGIIFK